MGKCKYTHINYTLLSFCTFTFDDSHVFYSNSFWHRFTFEWCSCLVEVVEVVGDIIIVCISNQLHSYIVCVLHLDASHLFSMLFSYPETEAESSKLNVALRFFFYLPFAIFMRCVWCCTMHSAVSIFLSSSMRIHSLNFAFVKVVEFCNSNLCATKKKDKIALQTIAHRSDGAQFVRWKWW